jgi:hypothetical protein
MSTLCHVYRVGMETARFSQSCGADLRSGECDLTLLWLVCSVAGVEPAIFPCKSTEQISQKSLHNGIVTRSDRDRVDKQG